MLLRGTANRKLNCGELGRPEARFEDSKSVLDNSAWPTILPTEVRMACITNPLGLNSVPDECATLRK